MDIWSGCVLRNKFSRIRIFARLIAGQDTKRSKRERERERQTDRQTDRLRESWMDGWMDGWIESETDRRDRQTTRV